MSKSERLKSVREMASRFGSALKSSLDDVMGHIHNFSDSVSDTVYAIRGGRRSAIIPLYLASIVAAKALGDWVANITIIAYNNDQEYSDTVQFGQHSGATAGDDGQDLADPPAQPIGVNNTQYTTNGTAVTRNVYGADDELVFDGSIGYNGFSAPTQATATVTGDLPENMVLLTYMNIH